MQQKGLFAKPCESIHFSQSVWLWKQRLKCEKCYLKQVISSILDRSNMFLPHFKQKARNASLIYCFCLKYIEFIICLYFFIISMILIYQSSIKGPNNGLKTNRNKTLFHELLGRLIQTWEWKWSHWSLKTSGRRFAINALYELIMAEMVLGSEGWEGVGSRMAINASASMWRTEKTLLLSGQTVLAENIS